MMDWRFQVLLIQCLLHASIAQPSAVPSISPSQLRSEAPTVIPRSPSSNPSMVLSLEPSRPRSSAPSMSPTTVPVPTTPAPTLDCINSLSYLEEQLTRRIDPNIRRTYKLCSNTIFSVGDLKDNGACCKDGQSPIYPRSNVKIQCGDDGSSKNNCFVRGGKYQLLALDLYSGEDHITNFEMQGVTFESAEMAGLLLVQSGVMQFTDCLFMNHKNHGVVQLFYYPPLAERINGIEEETRANIFGSSRKLALYTGIDRRVLRLRENVRRRKLEQQDEDKPRQRQVVNFVDCVFKNNAQGEISSTVTQRGIVSVDSDYNDVIVERCIFRDNAFEVEPQGYAISMRKRGYYEVASTLKIQDSCFYANKFVGNAPVEIVGEVEVIQQNNTGDESRSDQLSCRFLAHILRDGEKPRCKDYTSEGVCPLNGRNVTSVTSSSVYTKETMNDDDKGSSALVKFIKFGILLAVAAVVSLVCFTLRPYTEYFGEEL